MASLPSAPSIPTGHTETEVAVQSYQPSASTDVPYRIFINHRGEVKKTFASTLYYRLLSHGFKPFLDKREMRGGEYIISQIESAIKSASLHIAIFSKGYAESNWCLDELVLMTKSARKIIPVFYKVKPSDVKWTRGETAVYARALRDLETKKTHDGKPRYDSATLENWRNALSDVAGRSGFELETYNGDRGELLEMVVKRVQEISEEEKVVKGVQEQELVEKEKFVKGVQEQEILEKEKVVKRVQKQEIVENETFRVAKYPYGVDEKVADFEKTLKSSYDGLDTVEKEIFLDIASFFIGEKRDMAIKIWDGSGWNGRNTFQSLQNKSLVEVDSENKIKMHNHLRDMGRNEASGSPRRLWHWTEDIDNLLLQYLRNDQVRGLRTPPDHVSTEVPAGVSMVCYHLSGHESKPNKQQNRNLQLLDVEGADARILMEKLNSTNLIWLRWRNCSDSCLPDWVPMHNLRVLEVSSSILKKLWKKKSQAPLELRELVITSPLSELPKSIGELKHLELISLKCSSGNVKTLPKQFCDLQSLIRLELTNCSEMKSLPDSFGFLTKLEHIDLSGSEKLERLPDSMGKLTNLEHIDLSRSKKLERLPKSFGGLIRLKYLGLSCCNNLTIDSNTLGNIRTLEYINLSDCHKIGFLPLQVAHQRSLERLYCAFLQLVPSPLYGNLKELKLRKGSNCERLECLPIPGELLTQLAKLTVNECVFPERSFQKNEGETGASKHVQLQDIELCKTEIPEVSFAEGFCPNLRRLLINSCNQLVKVGTLPDALVELVLTSCHNLKTIEGLCGLANLQMLSIKQCGTLQELSSIETLVSLEVFDVSECEQLERIEGLAQLTKLRRLDIIKCSELKELPGVEHLMSLKWLVATGCPKLQWSDQIVEQLRKRQLAKLNLDEGMRVSSQKS